MYHLVVLCLRSTGVTKSIQLCIRRCSLVPVCADNLFRTLMLFIPVISIWLWLYSSRSQHGLYSGIPMNNLRDKNVDVELSGDASLIELEKWIMETEDNNQCVYLIEQYLLKKLYGFTSERFARMNAVVQSINNGQQDITELSQSACLGYKQFKRVFAEYTGLNPKEFLQIARFRNALHCLHAGSQIRLNQLAYDWGYCDKSHLIKDFKTFMGYTPKEYLSICDSYSEYLSLFNSVFINGERETKSNGL